MTARYDPPILTIAVLAYRKQAETRQCLISLRDHIKLDRNTYQIVLLENGSEEEYPWRLYQEGLCDVVIVKRLGYGGGVGQTDLLRYSPSTYTLFVQCDQVLVHDIDDYRFDRFVQPLESECDVVDLNGDQSGRGVWTDRAHLIKTDFFNSLAPYPQGGPGELHDLRWNENYLQEKVSPQRIAHVKPVFFSDNGKDSIRSNPDGSRWKHYTDTKQLWLIAGPVKERYVYPFFSDAEWESVLSTQQWPDGKIPEREVAHSFRVWH